MVEVRLFENKRTGGVTRLLDDNDLFISSCKHLLEIAREYGDGKMCITVRSYRSSTSVNYSVSVVVDGSFKEKYSFKNEPIESMTLTSGNKIYRNIGRLIDGLFLLDLVVDEVNIFSKNSNIIDYISVIEEVEYGED